MQSWEGRRSTNYSIVTICFFCISSNARRQFTNGSNFFTESCNKILPKSDFKGNWLLQLNIQGAFISMLLFKRATIISIRYFQLKLPFKIIQLKIQWFKIIHWLIPQGKMSMNAVPHKNILLICRFCDFRLFFSCMLCLDWFKFWSYNIWDFRFFFCFFFCTAYYMFALIYWWNTNTTSTFKWVTFSTSRCTFSSFFHILHVNIFVGSKTVTLSSIVPTVNQRLYKNISLMYHFSLKEGVKESRELEGRKVMTPSESIVRHHRLERSVQRNCYHMPLI